MPESKRQTVSTYLKRVMALKEERRRTPSEEELKSIAREIGLSDEDLAAIDQAAADHAVRGQGYLDHGRYGDAITELEESVAVAPRRVEWLHALARARAGRWREGREATDRERAEALARECLEIDPRHDASYEVLNELDSSGAAPKTGGGDVPPAKRAAVLLTLFVVAVLLAVVIGAIVLWRSAEAPAGPAVNAPAPAGPAANAPAPVRQAVNAPPPMAAEPVANQAGAQELDVPVPVTLDAGSTGVVLGLDARLSRLVSYSSGKSFYTLNALLENRGATEIDKLGLRLELLDEAGSAVDRASFDAPDKAAPVLRPGDAHAFHHLKETRGSVRAARLVVEMVEQNPAAASYAAAEPLDFEWQTDRPADFEITLRERSYRFSESAFPKDGSGYFDAVIEVENTGQRTIRALELEAEIAGPGDGWTVRETGHVTTASGPALRPGEVRLERFIEKVDERPGGYRMFVVAIR